MLRIVISTTCCCYVLVLCCCMLLSAADISQSYCSGREQKYVGDRAANGRKEGRGRLMYRSGDIYEGSFSNDEKHGNGTCFLSDGSRGPLTMAGNWLRRVRCMVLGDVAMLSRNRGVKYVGEWHQDRMSGRGRFLFHNGDAFEGVFANGEAHGPGLLTFSDGHRYEGEFVDGKRKGRGMLSMRSGEVFVGTWLNDQTFVDNSFCIGAEHSYSGLLVAGLKHGHGIVHYKNGDKYEGVFHNGRKHGQGTCVLSDTNSNVCAVIGKVLRGVRCLNQDEDKSFLCRRRSKKYVGEWANDEMSGRGRFYYRNGDVYDGDFVDGSISGRGAMNYTNGDMYIGDWKHNHQSGSGINIMLFVFSKLD